MTDRDTVQNPDEELLDQLGQAETEEAQIEEAPEDVVPEAPAEHMVLRMPRRRPYEQGFEDPNTNMDYGPASRNSPNHAQVNIKFTANGDGDGFAVVPVDHPLLDSLMRKYPQVEVVESNPRPEAYVCEVCDKEYKTKGGLSTHKRSHK